jgi:hypothetical protein|uniref:Uncharacterized protein n=1 Tax=Fagus sylvatica TaxID=28930 RepID=A0A2N9H0F2_FAGSY
MKTVSGKVLSSKPISLKKATSTLSTFVATENGASPVISAYLRRALSAFKELRQHEKDFRAPSSGSKRERSKSEILSEVDTVGENPTRSIEVSQAPRHKPKKRHRSESSNSIGSNPTQSAGEFGNFADNGGAESKLKVEAGENPGQGNQHNNVETENDRKKHKKKKKEKVEDGDDNIGNVQIDKGRMGIEEEPESNKKNKDKSKKKKKKNEGGDFENNGIEADEGKIGIKEVKKEKESKKRKSKEVEEKGVDDGKNKKRRKTG